MRPLIDKRPFSHPLLLISLFGLLLRLPNLGRDSLWLDEAISYLAAQLPLAQILNNTVQSSHPPLYYLLLSGWSRAVPGSDAALRGLSLAWGVLLIPLIGYFVRELFANRRVALLVALMVAVSPFHILYSHELRMYTLLMFLVTLGTWGYWQVRREQSSANWLLFALVWTAAVYTHLFALLALGAVNLHAMTEQGRRTLFWRVFFVSAGIGVLFAPWLLSVLAESNQTTGSLRPLNQPTLRNPIKPLTSPAFLLFGLSNNPLLSGAALFITLSLAVVLVMSWRSMGREGVASPLRLVLMQIGLLLGVPLTVYVIRPFFLPERTMAAASPFLLILLAWGITQKQTPLPYLAGAALLLMGAATTLYHLGQPLKPPYRAAMRTVLAQHAPGDRVLHTSDGSYLPALRYANLTHHALLAGDPDPRKPSTVYEAVGGEVWSRETALGQNGRLWLIVALEHSVDWQQEEAAYFLDERPLHDSFDIGGIRIYLFE